MSIMDYSNEMLKVEIEKEINNGNMKGYISYDTGEQIDFDKKHKYSIIIKDIMVKDGNSNVFQKGFELYKDNIKDDLFVQFYK